MKGSDQLILVVAWFFNAVIIAGIVHISSILLMPQLAPKNAFARIASLTPLGEMMLLPDFAPGKALLPFEDPAMSIGICRYDLSQGALRLTGNFNGDNLVLLSFHSRAGENFYSMTDRGTTGGNLNVLVMNREQSDALDVDESDDSAPPELHVVAPANQGFIMIRMLATDPGDRPEAKNRVKALDCHVDKSNAE